MSGPKQPSVPFCMQHAPCVNVVNLGVPNRNCEQIALGRISVVFNSPSQVTPLQVCNRVCKKGMDRRPRRRRSWLAGGAGDTLLRLEQRVLEPRSMHESNDKRSREHQAQHAAASKQRPQRVGSGHRQAFTGSRHAPNSHSTPAFQVSHFNSLFRAFVVQKSAHGR